MENTFCSNATPGGASASSLGTQQRKTSAPARKKQATPNNRYGSNIAEADDQSMHSISSVSINFESCGNSELLNCIDDLFEPSGKKAPTGGNGAEWQPEASTARVARGEREALVMLKKEQQSSSASRPGAASARVAVDQKSKLRELAPVKKADKSGTASRAAER